MIKSLPSKFSVQKDADGLENLDEFWKAVDLSKNIQEPDGYVTSSSISGFSLKSLLYLKFYLI